MRFVLVAGLALAALVLTGLADGPASGATLGSLAPDESLTVASEAAGWLAHTQLRPDGAAIGADGSNDGPATARIALALHAAGLEQEARGPLAWLEAHPNTTATDSAGDSPPGLALLILVASAEGRSPNSFGGQDLVARLLATRQNDGQFGETSARYAADPPGGPVPRQGLVLTALGAAGQRDEEAAQWLLDRECPDGGWWRGRTEPSDACPQPDSVTTGLAMQGLAAVGQPVPTSAVDALAELQLPDGGFPFLPGLSNPFSTAIGLQGLLAAGQDPNSPRWRKGSDPSTGTLFQALQRFATDPSGGYSSAPGLPAQPGATETAVVAATGSALPLPATAEPPADATGDPQSSDPQGSAPVAPQAGGFSLPALLIVGALALGAIAALYVVRRRRQAL